MSVQKPSTVFNYVLVFALGILVASVAFTFRSKKELQEPVSFSPVRKSATDQMVTEHPRRNRRPSVVIQAPDVSVDETNPHYAAHVADVKRLVTEETRKLTVVLALSPAQRSEIEKKLESFRLQVEPSEVTQYDLVTSVLSPAQREAYDKYVEENQRGDAEHLASVRVHMIEKAAGPLTDAQRSSIYEAIAASLINGVVVTDADILKPVLTASQYSLWSQSSDAEPARIGE
jgi:hypothetical protein